MAGGMTRPEPDTETVETAALETVRRYHDGTKHHFNRFARSLGYLDWASQPRPFRSYANAPLFPLYPSPEARPSRYEPVRVTLDRASAGETLPTPVTAAAIGDLLRHSLGLSAWKAVGQARWSLRVNPSSGNLHPTEAYVAAPALDGLADGAASYHYAPDRHALELRCRFAESAWAGAAGKRACLIVFLTSIHWRESWKYGERAFRYCQHDLGHAVAAVSIAAGMLGWRARLAPGWSHAEIAALTGIDRDGDFVEAEREDPGVAMALWCDGGHGGGADGPIGNAERAARDAVAGPPVGDAEQATREVVARQGVPFEGAPFEGAPFERDPIVARHLVAAVRAGAWSGSASQLSEDHVDWSFIGEVASASADPGRPGLAADALAQAQAFDRDGADRDTHTTLSTDRGIDARALALRRRSAVGFDGRTAISRRSMLAMLGAVMPGMRAPWSTIWWTPRIHLLLFVHRVEDMTPGMYLLARDPHAVDRLRADIGRELLWERADDALPLWLLAPLDVRPLSARLSCDQAIASDGFFSLGMLADFDASLGEFGPSFYRHLFWESGVVGQVLYLEAEAAGARGTGIGCFYDDAVHDVLALGGHAWQSLYHFTVGQPVDDVRLRTEPGYPWERAVD
jgi:SagB-type dehydrogenase family enzyme